MVAELAKSQSLRRIDASTPPAWMFAEQIEVWKDESPDIAVICGSQSGKTAIEAPWLLRLIAETAEHYKLVPDEDTDSPAAAANYFVAGTSLETLRAQAVTYIDELFSKRLKLGTLTGKDHGRPKFIFSAEGSLKLVGKEIPIIIHFLNWSDPDSNESFTALGGVCDETGQPGNKEISFEANNRRLMVARAIGKKLGIPRLGQRLFTTTPYTWGWFKRRVVDLARNAEHGFSYHNWPTWVNPSGPTEDECRLLLEQGMPLWRWQMMYLGMYTKPAGIVLESFDPETCVVKRFKIPDHWEVVQGTDFGHVNTAGVWMARDPEEDIWYLYSTYHCGKIPVEDHVRAFRSRVKKDPYCIGGALSEDDWRSEYADEGFLINRPPIKDRAVGFQMLDSLFATGRLKIFSDLEAIISDIQTLSYELDDYGEPNPKKIEDESKYHRVAALRYAATVAGDYEASMSVYRRNHGRTEENIRSLYGFNAGESPELVQRGFRAGREVVARAKRTAR